MKKTLLLMAVLLTPVAALGGVVGIRINIGPPVPRMESPPVPPAPQYVWLPGYWAWRGNKYVWLEGHWVLPPAPGYVWEPPRWENQGGAWVFYDGHWRPAAQPDPGYAYQPPPPPVQPEVVETAPPPPIEEIRPPIPFGGAVWIDGYWHWSGVRFIWVGGRWSAPPSGYVWRPYRWDRREDGRWQHEHGHWHPSEGRR